MEEFFKENYNNQKILISIIARALLADSTIIIVDVDWAKEMSQCFIFKLEYKLNGLMFRFRKVYERNKLEI